MPNQKLISIVAPAYNEAENIAALTERIDAVMRKLSDHYDYELILVDDGSTDDTWDKTTRASRENKKIRGIRLTRNFGQQMALTAGIDRARGDAVIYLDSDLQHPPKLIPQLLTKWEVGAQVVHTLRKATKREPFLKSGFSKLFYQLAAFLSDTPPQAGMADFKLLDKKVYQQLKKMRERNRFLRGMVPWMGYKSVTVEYTAPERNAGQPWYNLRRSFNLAQTGLMSLSTRPLRYVGYLGLLLTTIAGLGLLSSLIIMLIKRDFRYISPSVLLALFNTLLIGIVISALGVVAFYISYLHKEVINRPLYIVGETTDEK